MLSLQRALRLGYLGDDDPPPVEEDTAEAPPGAILQPIVGASAAQQAAWANQAAAVGNTSAGDAAGGGGVYAAANIPEGQSSMQAALNAKTALQAAGGGASIDVGEARYLELGGPYSEGQAAINSLASNPNSVKANGAGKVGVNPNSAGTQSLFATLASGMTAGGNAYSAQQLMTILANAMKTGQSLFLPSSVLAATQKKPVASSSNDWLIAGGIGVAVLAMFAVIAMGRK